MRQLWLQLALQVCFLTAGLWWSFAYLSECWTCRSQGTDCFEVRKTLHCAGAPLQAVLSSAELSATLTCPWDRGAAEVRICVLAAAMGLILQAMIGVLVGNKHFVQSSIQGLGYMPLFLGLVTVFDALGVVAAGDACNPFQGIIGAGHCWSSVTLYTVLVGSISTILTLFVRSGLKVWVALQPLDDL